jgi:hypothetical protein
METINAIMQTGWYDTLMTAGLWGIQWLFFALLIQLTVVVLVKTVFVINSVENIDIDLVSNIAIFSMLWAVFIQTYAF